MNIDLWLAFVVLVSALVLTPGPSVLLVAAHGASYGFKPTLATICGDLSANICQIALVSTAVSIIQLASPMALWILKWIGVMYLVYLGIRMWSLQAQHWSHEAGNSTRLIRRLYTEGFTASALNPKALCFFFALFPQFVDPTFDTGTQCFVLGITFICLDGLALLAYSCGAVQLGGYVTEENRQRWSSRIGGSLLITAAIILACWSS